MFGRLPVSAHGTHIRWTVVFLWIFCSGLLFGGNLSCASKTARVEESGSDLFEKAEQESSKIASQIDGKAQSSAVEQTEELERIEEKNRKEAIEQYRTLLKKKDRLDPATYENSLINLGNIVFEQCLANYRKQMRAYNKEYEAFKSGATEQAPIPPRYDFAPAREVYEVFLDAFPASPLLPEVVYYLAYSYEEEGDLDRAVALFDELALTAPDARFASEV